MMGPTTVIGMGVESADRISDFTSSVVCADAKLIWDNKAKASVVMIRISNSHDDARRP
jgi:hypothetical protein